MNNSETTLAGIQRVLKLPITDFMIIEPFEYIVYYKQDKLGSFNKQEFDHYELILEFKPLGLGWYKMVVDHMEDILSVVKEEYVNVCSIVPSIPNTLIIRDEEGNILNPSPYRVSYVLGKWEGRGLVI